MATPLRVGAAVLLPAVLTVLLLEALHLAFNLPSSLAVLDAATQMVRSGQLPHDIVVSGSRWLAGWTVGAALGVAAGYATGLNAPARLGFASFFTLLRAIPFICLVPISVRFFGYDEIGKVFIVAWAVFFLCWVAVHQAALNLPDTHSWRAKSLRLSPWRSFNLLAVPSTHDALIIALRASLLVGLIVTAVAELAGAHDRSSGRFWSEGLGYRLFRTLDQARDDQLFAAILAFSLLGVAAEQTFSMARGLIQRGVRRSRIRQAETEISRAKALMQQRSADPAPSYAKPVMLDDFSASYGRKPVLKNVNLTVEAGSCIAILGRSGSGKSTLLKAIAAFAVRGLNQTGRISFGESSTNPAVGVVLQNAPVFEGRTIWANVRTGTPRSNSDQSLSQTLELLEDFELDEKASVIVDELSGGQAQRVSFATALHASPSVLLCDEPNAALDSITKRRIQTFLHEKVIRSGRTTTIWVTHDIEEALVLADRVFVILDKGLVEVPVARSGYDDLKRWTLSAEFSAAREEIIARLSVEI